MKGDFKSHHFPDQEVALILRLSGYLTESRGSPKSTKFQDQSQSIASVPQMNRYLVIDCLRQKVTSRKLIAEVLRLIVARIVWHNGRSI